MAARGGRSGSEDTRFLWFMEGAALGATIARGRRYGEWCEGCGESEASHHAHTLHCSDTYRNEITRKRDRYI